MNLLHALIFGIVEGITEFLPISSTGHLILTAHLLKLQQTDFLISFQIIIQLGAIMAVLTLYGKKVLSSFEICKRVAVAFLPTAIIGFVLYKIIKKFLLTNHEVVLWSLFIGGIVLIVFEYFHKEDKSSIEEINNLSYRKAFLIGIFQSLAVVPGVSRAAATIVGGLLLGLKRTTIVEFSFLLALPTMCAATGLDLLKNKHAFTGDQISFLLVGFISSFFVAILSIKFLLYFIKNHSFISFGIYRIVLALVFWIFIH